MGPSPLGRIYRIGYKAAVDTVLMGVAAAVITFLPRGKVSVETVRDWFVLFQESGFMGMVCTVPSRPCMQEVRSQGER